MAKSCLQNTYSTVQVGFSREPHVVFVFLLFLIGLAMDSSTQKHQEVLVIAHFLSQPVKRKSRANVTIQNNCG